VTTEAKLIIERVDCESMYSTHSSFDRASLADDLESISRTGASSALRKKKLLLSTPQFTARLRPKRCQEGQSIRFNCSVSGIPEPTMTWQRANGTILNPSARIHISNNYGLCSLEIVKVRPDDEGLYIVTASNSEGQVSSSASLDVEVLKSNSLSKRKTNTMSQSLDMDWLSGASGNEEDQPVSLAISPDKQNLHIQTLSSSLPPEHFMPLSLETIDPVSEQLMDSVSAGLGGVPVLTVTRADPAEELGGYFTLNSIQFADDGSDTEVACSDDEAVHASAAQGTTDAAEQGVSPALDSTHARV
jgi:hypothetical protein